MARDDLEDEGAESDTSNVIVRAVNRNNDYGDDEDDEDEDEDDDDDGGMQPLNGGVFGFGGMWAMPTICPCCNPNNLNGYICPDGVRLQELPQNANFQEHQMRRQIQPGHTQCRDCRNHLPIVDLPDPVARDSVADRFRCRFFNSWSDMISKHQANDLQPFLLSLFFRQDVSYPIMRMSN